LKGVYCVCSAMCERKNPVPVAMSTTVKEGLFSGVVISGWSSQPRICEANLCWVVSLEIVRDVCGDGGVEASFRLVGVAGKRTDSCHCR